MRLASEEKSLELTGFVKNAVSPFGLNVCVPILMTEKMAQLDPPVVYLGAGHVDWKVGVCLQDLTQLAKVAHLS